MPKNARRLNLFVPNDILDSVDFYSEKFSIPKAHLISMSIRAGLGNIIRAISPEDLLTPEVLKKMGASYEELAQGSPDRRPGAE